MKNKAKQNKHNTKSTLIKIRNWTSYTLTWKQLTVTNRGAFWRVDNCGFCSLASLPLYSQNLETLFSSVRFPLCILSVTGRWASDPGWLTRVTHLPWAGGTSSRWGQSEVFGFFFFKDNYIPWGRKHPVPESFLCDQNLERKSLKHRRATTTWLCLESAGSRRKSAQMKNGRCPTDWYQLNLWLQPCLKPGPLLDFPDMTIQLVFC